MSTDTTRAPAGPGAGVDPGDTAARTTLENEQAGHPRHDLPVLEVYRGLAAVMVVFTHVGFISGVGIAGAWAGWLSRLDFGVALFFLLSGFLLFRPYVQAAYGRRPAVSVRGYLRRRYVRIYPAFLVVLAFNYLITPKAREAPAELWWQTLLMVQNYTVNFVNQLPGLVQIWSLAVEVSFYLALPLLARLVLGPGTAAARASAAATEVRTRLAARTPAQVRQAALDLDRRPALQRWIGRLLNARPWHVLLPDLRPGIILGALVVASCLWRLYFMVETGGLNNELLWLPAFIDWFAAGMAMAWVRERANGVPQLIRDVAGSAGACWSLALAGFWLATTELAGPYGLEGPTTGEAMFKHLMFLVSATFLLLPAVFGDPRASWRRVAGNRFFTWLGQISFGLFLWHPMLMEAIRRMLRMSPMDGGFWLTLSLTLLAGAAAATLSWRYVEEPLQRRFRHGFRSPAPGDRAPAPGNRRVIRIRLRPARTPEPGA